MHPLNPICTPLTIKEGAFVSKIGLVFKFSPIRVDGGFSVFEGKLLKTAGKYGLIL